MISVLSLLYFENDISLNSFNNEGVDKNPMLGTVAQIFYLGLGFYFMSKKGTFLLSF